MGLSVQSNVTKDSINEVTKIVNKQTNTIVSKSRSNCVNANIGEIDIGTVAECGVASTTITDTTVSITQANLNSCKLSADNNIQITNDELTTIKNQLNQLVNTQIKNNQGFIPAAISLQSNVSITAAEIHTNINNITTNTINTSCQNTVSNYNSGKLVICADIANSNIVIDQSSDIYAVTQCVTTAVLNNVFKTQVQREVVQQTDTELASKQTGVSGLFKWLIIIAVIIGVVLIVGIIILAVTGAFSSGGDKKKGGSDNIEQLLLMSSMSHEGGGSSSILPLLMAEEGKE